MNNRPLHKKKYRLSGGCLALFLIVFLAGYNLTPAGINQAQAIYPPAGPEQDPTPLPPGTAATVVANQLVHPLLLPAVCITTFCHNSKARP